MSIRQTGEVLYACSSGSADPAQRAALGHLVTAVRRDAPSVDVRDTPVEMLASAEDRAPVRVAVPLTLTEGTDVSAALAVARRGDPELAVAAPLGPDWSLAEICVQRLIEAGARKADTIVLGVAGAQGAESVQGYQRAARLVSAVWGGPESGKRLTKRLRHEFFPQIFRDSPLRRPSQIKTYRSGRRRSRCRSGVPSEAG